MKMLLDMVDVNRVTEDRRRLHACAETGFALEETFRVVWERLEEMGLSPRQCGRCGIVAEVGSGARCVLLRADMDALAMQEETGLAFAARNGCMHACGHDLHTAMLLEAARLLKAQEDNLPGTVRLMFQPAEESLEGAADMLKNGLLEPSRPEAAFMLHVLTGLELPVGTAIVSAPGVSAPAAGMFEICVQGKGCHGASPATGIDPILAAAHMVLNLQQIQSRELSLHQACVLTVGMLQAGDAPNVIPDRAVLRGSFRVIDTQAQAYIMRRIGEIAHATANLGRCSAEVRWLGSCPPLKNDAQLSQSTLATLRTLLGTEQVLLSSEIGGSEATKNTGSEDFANISQEVPALMVALAAGRPQDGHVHPAHHPGTTFDEAALPVGAAAYACMALNALQGPKG